MSSFFLLSFSLIYVFITVISLNSNEKEYFIEKDVRNENVNHDDVCKPMIINSDNNNSLKFKYIDIDNNNNNNMIIEMDREIEMETITNKENINYNNKEHYKGKDEDREVNNIQINNKILKRNNVDNENNNKNLKKNKNNLFLYTDENINKNENVTVIGKILSKTQIKDKDKERDQVGKVVISPVFGKCATPNNKWKSTILSPARTYNKNTTLDSPGKEFVVNVQLNGRAYSNVESDARTEGMKDRNKGEER